MSARDAVVALIRRTTGAHIYRVLPRGLDLHHDIANALQRQPFEVVFDVGANVGQSAVVYAERYPAARIYCFEPVASSFGQLRDAVGAEARIQCFQTALGRDEGTARMVVEGRSDMSYLARDANPSAAEGSIEVICVTSLDAFCQRHGIGRINYLKVDVEGAEMDVLEGGRGMLEDQRVDLIELEAGMRSTSRRHTPWGALQGFLEPRGYLLFGVYEQVTEWPTRRPELRRANLAFISEAVAEANRSPT